MSCAKESEISSAASSSVIKAWDMLTLTSFFACLNWFQIMAMKSKIQSLSLLAWPSGSLHRLGAFVLQNRHNPHTSLLLGQLGVPFAVGRNQGKGTKSHALPAGFKTALCRAGWLWLGDRQKGWDALCMSVLCLVICGKHCYRAWYHVSLLF